MHIEDEKIHLYLDGALPAPDRETLSEHLSICMFCTKRLDSIQVNRIYTQNVFSKINASIYSKISAHKALEKFTNRTKEMTHMKSWFKRPAWIAALLVLAIAVAMAFPSVRAAASNVLGMFRIEQVKVVSVDMLLLDQYQEGMQSQKDNIAQFFKENIVFTEYGEFTSVNGAQEAYELAGFMPRLPGQRNQISLGVIPAQTVEITIDVPLWNSILETLNQTATQLPDDLNGKKVIVNTPTAITSGFGECASIRDASPDTHPPSTLGDCLFLVQMPAVSVATPEGLDVIGLTEAMLQVSGMNADEAKAFSKTIDWSTTLVLPIPAGEGLSSNDVSVDGEMGTLITNGETTEFSLIWTKDGMLYGMTGMGDPSRALDLANRLTK